MCSSDLNFGGMFEVANGIMDNPGDAKYGMTDDQLIEAFRMDLFFARTVTVLPSTDSIETGPYSFTSFQFKILSMEPSGLNT